MRSGKHWIFRRACKVPLNSWRGQNDLEVIVLAWVATIMRRIRVKPAVIYCVFAALCIDTLTLSPTSAQVRELEPFSEAASEVASGNDAAAFDIDAPPETTNKLAPFWFYGGNVEVQSDYENNFDLDDKKDDDLGTLDGSLELAVTYKPSSVFEVFLNLELSRELAIVEEGRDRDRPTRLRLKQFNFTVREIFDDFSLKVGRQRFDDEREWLYDEELDAVRLVYDMDPLAIETAVSRRRLVKEDLLNEETREKINNYELRGTAEIGRKSEATGYFFYRDDRDERPEDLLFFGVQSVGELTDSLDYWLDAAYVTGERRSRRRTRDISGFGFDVGGTYISDLPLEPSATLGVAFGTGDGNPDDDVDRDFRQSGLQDNSAKFNGVTSFKYYGEVFDPELSNMSILTAGVGIRPSKKSSIDLIYHYYRQNEASDDLRDVAIDADPSGRSRDLGHGIDLVLGYREIENVSLEGVIGAFLPGNAFVKDNDPAFFAGIEIQCNF